MSMTVTKNLFSSHTNSFFDYFVATLYAKAKKSLKGITQAQWIYRGIAEEKNNRMPNVPPRMRKGNTIYTKNNFISYSCSQVKK